MKERDEAKRSLEDTEAQVQNLDNKLQSVQRERDALLAEVEEQKITHSLSIVALEQNNSSLRNELNELQGLQKFCDDVQNKYSDSKKQAAAQQSEISDLRRLLTSSEIEVESLKTSYGNVSSTTTCGAFESHQSSFAGTCDFVERIVEDISQLIGVESNFFMPSTPVRPSRRRPSLARKTEDEKTRRCTVDEQ